MVAKKKTQANRKSAPHSLQGPEKEEVLIYHGLRAMAQRGLGSAVVLTAAVVLAVFQLGFWAALPALVLAFGLMLLALIDIRTQLLPNMLVIPLGALGVVLAPLYGLSVGMAFLGGLFGFMAFMMVSFWGEKLLGRPALGMGDVKLLAALGCWSGPWGVLLIVLVASWVAVAWVAVQRRIGRLKAGQRFAFGPFLALGGWVAFVYTPVFQAFLMGN